MKRFYCTICKKYKRVRVMPASVRNPQEKNPAERTGVCKWHIEDDVIHPQLTARSSFNKRSA